jgi:hypothetical protein
MKLTLNELKYVINESKVQLLMELSNGAIEGMIRRAYPMYAEYFDCTLYELWNEYKDIAQSIGVENDDVQNYSSQQLKDYFRLKIRKDFKVNRINKRPEKIMKGIIRICLSDGINLFQDIAYYHQRLENYKNFIAIINYICSKGIYEQYDEDLGGLTFNELYKLYMPMIRGDAFIDWCKKTKATENKVFEGNAISMGNPHFVIFIKDDEDLLELAKTYGPEIELSAEFPEKTNVEFIKIKSPSDIELCVWERGCGITLACGTGACASVVAGILNAELENSVEVKLLGGTVKVTWNGSQSNLGEDVYLIGPAEYVFEAELK